VERFSTQERTRLFEHYMSMDPALKADRCFMEGRCMILAQSVFIDAQHLELLTNKLKALKS
jgi:hypothetical protein